MSQRSALAGAIGQDAAKLVTARAGSAEPVVRTDGGIVVVEDVRCATDEESVLGVFGHPRLGLALGDVGTDTYQRIREWRSALFGRTCDLDECVSGHFAVFFCDVQSRRLALCTDRFGSYAVYYRLVGDGIAFANRADLLFDAKPAISSQAVFDYLYFHCLPAPSTVHEDVYRLESGSILRWERGKLKVEQYWHRQPTGPRYRDFGEARRDFHSLLRQAIERESPDADTGAFLSGGTDSSTVVGLLCERSDRKIKSFSIGFDVPGYDEAEYARLASRHFGSQHREYYVTPDDLVARLTTVAASLDQPFGNSSILPAMICAERARDDGVTKLLAGDGGDELFGGNTRYAKQKVFDWYRKVPTILRRGLIEPVTALSLANRLPILRKLKSYVEQARMPMPDRMETYNLLEREGAEAILCAEWLAAADPDYPRRLQSQVWDELAANDLVDRMLEFDWKFTLADNDLRKVRYATAFASVEVGFPLLDDDVAEFSLRLRPEWKVRGTNTRWFFKEALRDFLPHEIIHKTKHGFGLPFGNWVCEHESLRKVTVSSVYGLADREVVKGDYVKSLFEDLLPRHPYYYGELVWVLMMLELWLQAHIPNGTRSP